MSPSPTSPLESSNRLRRAVTSLVVEVFHLNGNLLATGDALVHDLELTSARWQVLGAMARSPVPLPVAHLARNIGLARQSVQRVVDDMCAAGLLQLEPNPHHRRAMLVTMTEQGSAAYSQASLRQERWAEDLSADMSLEAIEAANAILQTLRRRLSGPVQANVRLDPSSVSAASCAP